MELSILWTLFIAGMVIWKVRGMRRSPEQLATIQAAIDDGAVLLDVRSAAEFDAGHLPGAQNVPVGRIGGAVAELKQCRRPVVVYCASGTRSGMAVRMLRSGGVAVVLDLGTFRAGQGLSLSGTQD